MPPDASVLFPLRPQTAYVLIAGSEIAIRGTYCQAKLALGVFAEEQMTFKRNQAVAVTFNQDKETKA